MERIMMLSRFKCLVVCSALGVTASALAMQPPMACSATSGARTLPLVELYTSEGCDSCPPADRWLRTTFPPGAATATRASVLAFHVDYWDGLGWHDRFSSHEYTERQRALMQAAGTRTVYTPQVLLQGRDRGLWRNGSITDTMQEIAREAPRARIALEIHPERGEVVVDVQASVVGISASDAEIHVAFTDSELASSVTAGENAGVRLIHDHVVRGFVAGPPFKPDGSSNGVVRLPLPRERGQNPTIVAFVQHRTKGQILQSLSIPLCGA